MSVLKLKTFFGYFKCLFLGEYESCGWNIFIVHYKKITKQNSCKAKVPKKYSCKGEKHSYTVTTIGAKNSCKGSIAQPQPPPQISNGQSLRYLRIWQLTPTKALGHWHEYIVLAIAAWQVPPFWHGFDKHGLIPVCQISYKNDNQLFY